MQMMEMSETVILDLIASVAKPQEFFRKVEDRTSAVVTNV
jgi:hypothetical protein